MDDGTSVVTEEKRHTMKTTLLAAGALVFLLAGCQHEYFLARPAWVPRAELDETALAAKAPATEGAAGGGAGGTQTVEDTVTGTYTFTTPKNVTELQVGSTDYSVYQLYVGEAKPTDTPLVVITVASKIESEAASGAGDLKAVKSRSYTLNGLTTQEWTGKTTEGLPFCELIISHGDTGEKLHAIAIARDEASRKIALDILASITWSPKH
jgi:hypothetical protein